MDLFQIIDDIAKVDPETLDRFDSRRAAFRNFLGFGKKVTATALPLAVSTLFTKAYGQTAALPAAVVATLNLALQLEYLEYFYYDTALNSSGLNLTADERGAFEIIRNDELLHINILRTTLGSAAIAPLTRASFDYTTSQNLSRSPVAPLTALGGTTSPTTGPFTDKAVFLLAAQQFVDTGVRAYKGGAPSLNTSTTKDILEAALNIHSVEARHSSRIRSLRRGGVQSANAPKSWITPDETPNTPGLPNNGVANSPTTVGPYLAGLPVANFPAEDNITQATLNVQTIGTLVSGTAGAEAFDEPLNAETVKGIAKNFAANPTALFN
ncbi:ferritin-like domain-containing protein [Hymenobacter ruricola]|uniref:Ferritin-like domain-containing protein n=1 Tax=Hymenobacter ruricola TaxID=2791023 RepID=A0ABS0I3G6_9BACT|nr:ferritin-like domain-containing protein [Hymenobacter ruricola]MBF9221487.1 ferritin-like domain-containing protein [Hymenobacter ruricola]